MKTLVTSTVHSAIVVIGNHIALIDMCRYCYVCMHVVHPIIKSILFPCQLTHCSQLYYVWLWGIRVMIEAGDVLRTGYYYSGMDGTVGFK